MPLRVTGEREQTTKGGVRRGSRSFSVLLIEDHHMYRAALAAVVRADPRLRLAGEAENGADGLDAASESSPDVAVIELGLALAGDPDFLRAISRRSPHTRVLLVAAQVDSAVLRSLIAGGAAGYIRKDASEEAVAAAIVTVGAGEAVLSPELLSEFVHGAQAVDRQADLMLTSREDEIGGLAAEGYSNAQIAAQLHVSTETVKTHLAHLYRKLGVSGRTAAAAELARRRLTRRPPAGGPE